MFACAVQCMFGQLGEKEQEKMNIVSRTNVEEQVEKNRKERKRIDQKMTMREREWAVRST